MSRICRIIFSLSLFLILSITPVSAKSYSIESDVFDLTINSNKSAEVTERLTYNFDGSFSWAEMWIPTKITRQGNVYQTSIENFQVNASDYSEVSILDQHQEKDKFYAKWGYQANDESKTFIINYLINNAVHKYPEVAEFYWQIIGNDWQIAHQNVEAIVKLPQSVDDLSQILVYGHGPLIGRSEIVDNQRVKFTADRVEKGQFLEIRVIFPSYLIAGNIDVIKTKAEIKAEEKKFVSETINSAKRVQMLDKPFKLLIRIAPVLSLASFIIWFLWWFDKWNRFGKEHRVSDIPEYFRELPDDLTPAEVDVLLKQGGEPGVNSFTATIFDLARRGFLKIKDQMVQKTGLFTTKQVFKSTLILDIENYNQDKSLKDYEKDILQLLFFTIAGTKPSISEKLLGKETARENKNDSHITLDEIKSWLKKHPREFQEKFSEWKKSVIDQSQKLKFLEWEGQILIRKSMIIVCVLTVIGFFTFNILVIIFLIAGLVLSGKLKRWTPVWAQEVAEWNAFKKFLTDFAGHSFKVIPPEAYKLWEHYLVFAILFGIADKIIKMLPLIWQNPNVSAASWYYVSSATGSDLTRSAKSMTTMVNSLNAFTSQLKSASTSAAHYSSGGGGGFSGGGGAGGGGGGGGAG